MATEAHHTKVPSWWTAPNELDVFAIATLIFLFILIGAVVHLYARFDRHAEHKSHDTPLRTTVPTLLTVALAYELFPPLTHFSVLLPTALILAALARDFMLWWEPEEHEHKEMSND